jgi:hypothetical protein
MALAVQMGLDTDAMSWTVEAPDDPVGQGLDGKFCQRGS